jgi:hypothetical protein
MFLRMCIAVPVLAFAAACTGASGPPPVGTWTCTGEAMGMKQEDKVTYAADGKTSGKQHVSGETMGMKIDVSVDYIGTWKLDGDQLTQTMTEAKSITGTMNGEPLPEEMKSGVTGSLDVPLTSTMTAEGGTMTVSNPGLTVTCKK